MRFINKNRLYILLFIFSTVCIAGHYIKQIEKYYTFTEDGTEKEKYNKLFAEVKAERQIDIIRSCQHNFQPSIEKFKEAHCALCDISILDWKDGKYEF